ncbi:hypothetical protein LCGC14_1212140 [marine sediment metagenome]|uniref:Uncharacterized protein n=1 Tax=marine sediment metagenome TaxID=412755 RepID=A0A0F9LI23_9ZZZZ
MKMRQDLVGKMQQGDPMLVVTREQHLLTSILLELSPRVAAFLCLEPLTPMAEFVDVINKRVWRDLDTRRLHSRETLGRANLKRCSIELLLRPGWPKTLLEELVHLYLPHAGHPKVYRTMKELTVMLKQTVMALGP